MPKTGTFYHECTNATDIAATNAFDAAKRHDINLHDTSINRSPRPVGDTFSGKLEGCFARINSVAGSATKVTVKVCADVAGTEIIIPDTEATIAFNVGSTTVGAIAINFSFAYLNSDDSIHVFYKTDTGTCTIDSLHFNWSE